MVVKKLKIRREKLLKWLRNGRIKMYPYFNLKKDWPTHPLITHIRKCIKPLIGKVVNQLKHVFDSQDLEHQILFRLTTFPPSQLFKRGLSLEEYFEEYGVYNEWQKIPFLDSKIISKFVLNQEIVHQVLKEQLLLVHERISKSNLSLNLIFKGIKDSNKIFTTKEKERYILKWESVNRKRYLTAVKFDSAGKIVDSVFVKFRKINKRLGRKFIQGFHYTHAPRLTEEIFGFFLEESKFPFAIQTVNWVKDSPRFRQDALLIKGFNPEHCIELRRLYTLPGSPRNIIGLLDRLIIKHFKKIYNIEAVTTTVMPMYAKTRSTTIASGIEQILYARPLSHKFICKKINGKKVWENVIPENQNWLKIHQNEIMKTHPRFLTYPTIGVYKQIGEKSFNEPPFVNSKIIGFDFK